MNGSNDDSFAPSDEHSSLTDFTNSMNDRGWFSIAWFSKLSSCLESKAHSGHFKNENSWIESTCQGLISIWKKKLKYVQIWEFVEWFYVVGDLLLYT